MPSVRRPGRPSIPAISSAQVIEEALRIIDEEGVEALSMRVLARRLDVQAPSLYHYFPNKEAILSAVARRILEELPAREAENEPWQDWFVHAMLEYRRILLAHPNVIQLMTTQLRLASFISDATFEHALAVMQSDGVPPGLMLTIAEGTEALVTGWVLYEIEDRGRQEAADGGSERRAERRRMIEANILDTDRRFERACDALVNGFVASIVLRGPLSRRSD